MTTKKVVNFGPGPAKIPVEVMQKAHSEFMNYDNTGMSVMELSHRGPEFAKILDSTENSLRELKNIPKNYKVLFLHGGGAGQFAAIALNLMGLKPSKSADYIVTGYWSAAAAEEAQKYGQVNRVCSKPHDNKTIEDESTWVLNPDASYVYYCANETINGVEFHFVPETNGVPIVCDMSSNFLSKSVDITKFGLVFGGTQKNLGCAGMVIVIVREDLIGHASPQVPLIWNYQKQIAMSSCINTPPMYSIYILGLVLDWIKNNGGSNGMEQLNLTKSDLVYKEIDGSDGFYCSPVSLDCRSRMNIPFHIGSGKGNAELEKQFLKEAEERGLLQLKGHRSVGGLRVSLYNAITIEEVNQLVRFMEDFRLKSGKCE